MAVHKFSFSIFKFELTIVAPLQVCQFASSSAQVFQDSKFTIVGAMDGLFTIVIMYIL